MRTLGISGFRCLLWLAVVLWAAGGAVAQQPPAASAPSKPFTTADAQNLTAEVLARVQLLRGLTSKRKLDVSVKTQDQLRGYLIAREKKESPPELLLADQKGLQKLRLIPQDMNLEAFTLDLLTEQVAGYYDEDAKTLFLMAQTPLTLQKGCLSHELTHALQDEYFDLHSLGIDRKDNDDCVLGILSLWLSARKP